MRPNDAHPCEIYDRKKVCKDHMANGSMPITKLLWHGQIGITTSQTTGGVMSSLLILSSPMELPMGTKRKTENGMTTILIIMKISLIKTGLCTGKIMPLSAWKNQLYNLQFSSTLTTKSLLDANSEVHCEISENKSTLTKLPKLLSALLKHELFLSWVSIKNFNPQVWSWLIVCQKHNFFLVSPIKTQELSGQIWVDPL